MYKQRKFQDAPVPAKKPKLNKRKVFDNKSDEEEEVQEKIGKNQQKSINPESSLLFENYQLRGVPKIWPYLEIYGPLPKIASLGSELVQNRPFVMFFREFNGKIHENFLKYRDTVMMELPNRRDVPEIDKILAILKKMFKETMIIDNVVLNVERILPSIRQILENGTTNLDANDFPELLHQISQIFDSRQLQCTERSVLHLRNELLRYFFLVSVDFILCVISMKFYYSTNQIQIKGFSRFDIFPNQYFQCRTDFESMTLFSSLHVIFKCHLPRSEHNASLWTVIPYEHEDNEHLLEYVFELGLIRILPEDVRRFLTDWMIEVRKRMRKRLEKGDLLRTVETIIQENRGNIVRMKREGEEIRSFLETINRNVLNCVDNFEIFGDKWADSVIEFVQYPTSRSSGSLKEKMATILKSLNDETPAIIHLSSLFSKSPSDKCLLLHTLLQLYRFMIFFSKATLRHVFHARGLQHFIFDWNLEEEVTDFKKISKYGKKFKKEREEYQIPTGTSLPVQTIVPPTSSKMEIPNVSRLFSDFNPPVPPPTYMPTNYMPIVPPVTFNQPYFVGNPSEIHQFQPEIKQNWLPIEQQKKQFSFQPLPPSSSYPPNGQINPKMEAIGTNVSSEVTEEELSNARALRTPSEVSGGGLLNPIDDDDDIFEGVPKKWIKAYKLALEWNEDLKAELEKVKNRLERLS